MPVELPNAGDIAQAVEAQLADEFQGLPDLNVQAVADAVLAKQREHATYVAQKTKEARIAMVTRQFAADAIYNEAVRVANEAHYQSSTAARVAYKNEVEAAQREMEDRIILAQNGPPTS